MSSLSTRAIPAGISRILILFVTLLGSGSAWAQDLLLNGLSGEVRVTRDADGTPHIFASSDMDAAFAQGYIHATDRFWQMDLNRHTAQGRLAELVGINGLAQDYQFRTLGLDRAANRSFAALDEDMRSWLHAYAAGVNEWLENNPLPPEHVALERAQVDPWHPRDTLVIAKLLAFGLSFDLSDLDNTSALLTMSAVGANAGFDGTALFSEDTYRIQPIDSRVSIPQAANNKSSLAPEIQARPKVASFHPALKNLVGNYIDSIKDIPLLAAKLEGRDASGGSNWWLIAPEMSATGNALLANDPHLALDYPSTFHEMHVLVDETDGVSYNVSGVAFAGVPGVVQGCTEFFCWGSTVHPMDVTDVYMEQLVFDADTGAPVATVYDGVEEPLQLISQEFFFNVVGDSIDDNLLMPAAPPQATTTLVVPRRNHGPILSVDGATAISVQYSGWGATHEVEAFRLINRASNDEEFRAALQKFDVGSQNFGYADTDGNIVYYTSAELPLRDDLQNLMDADGGIPPFFVRDGTGTFRHEWIADDDPDADQALPFAILPFDEMPQESNPARGYIANANNDPVGTNLDNNPLNQLRAGGGIYYLNAGYASLRMGRIDRVIQNHLASDGSMDIDEMKALQANNQLLDAELLLPHLLAAASNAAAGDAWQDLADLRNTPGMNEAINRLSDWDFSTPTGIQAGYDPGDDPDNLPEPSQAEIDASVAATLYSVWRGQAVRAVIDGTLAGVGLSGNAPGSTPALAAFRFHLEGFGDRQGFGVSGLDFFNVADAPDRAAARDFVLLSALRSALDLLASNDFAPAFNNSTDQEDYRWGLLHRITFDHPLGSPFSVPTAGGFENVEPDLPGVARSGGYQAVDASSHSARADGFNDFTFGAGPNRRFVGDMSSDGIAGEQIIPGGQSGVFGHPDYVRQLGRFLTNRYHTLLISSDDVDAAEVSRLVFGAAGYAIDGRLTASWYDPSHDGEGWHLEVLEDGRVLVIWFSYDEQGNQAWFLRADGIIIGSRIVFDDLIITSGPTFGPDFDPNDVVLDNFGLLEFIFGGCANARIRYDSPRFGIGRLENVVRLSTLAGLGCNDPLPSSAMVGDLPIGVSGAYFDPTHDGEGWFIELLANGTALVYWFSYGDMGRQAWFLGIGTVTGTVISVEAVITSGGIFGPDFDPDDVIVTQWGTITFDMGCDGGQVNYSSILPQYGSGVLQAVRLSTIAAAECN